MNSFLLLQEEDQDFFVTKYEKDVRDAVESRLKTVHFIGDILEHFFPILSDTLTVLAGGGTIDPDDSYLTIDEDDNTRLPSPSPGPTDGDDVIR